MNSVFRELQLPRNLKDFGWYVATVDGGDFSDYLHHDALLYSSTGGASAVDGGWFKTEAEALKARQVYYNSWLGIPITDPDTNAFDRAMKGV